MLWWLWLVLGLVLLFAELLTPGGFYFLFFGTAALVVGVLSGAGMGPEWLQLLVFSALSVASLMVFRKPLLQRLQRTRRDDRPVDEIAGEVVTLTEDLPARGVGRAELRGTVWNVENATAQALKSGQRCRVERVTGLKLVVGPES